MGLFSRIANAANQAFGGADAELLQNGILGRGEIRGLSPSGTTVQVANGLVERSCVFAVYVMLDGEPAYEVQVTQRVPEVTIPQLASGAVVAVRVDPKDRSRVAIDLRSPAPTVRLPQAEGEGSAAWLLENGAPITVVLVASQPLGVTSAKGDPVHALVLTIAGGVPEPYQIQVGNPVPASALPLLYPESKLHAKLGSGPNDVVVDWAAGPA